MGGVFAGGIFGSQSGGGGGGPDPTALKKAANLSDLSDVNAAKGVLGIPDVANFTDIPADLDDNATAQTAASTTFVTVATKTLTIIQSTKIHGVFVGNFDATTAAALASIKVVINGVSGRVQNISLQNITDKFPGTAQHYSAVLTPGTYTITAQMNRVSGTGTVNYRSGNLYVQAQQANLVSNSPSRIFYVSKNGGGTGADGTWTRPFSTISAACTAAQLLATDINTPYGICLMPGAGTTQYSDTAPITITKGGLSIFTFASPDFKAISVQYSGSFILNLTGSNLFFGCFGFEINCPSGAAWNSQPAAIYMTGTTAFRAFFSGMVLNSNATTRNGIYCDNPNATYRVFNGEVKAGTSVGPNLPAINHIAGNGQLINADIADRKSGGTGVGINLTAGTIVVTGSSVTGQITKSSNASALTISQDTLLNTGTIAAITTQATQGAPGTGVFIYSAVTNTTAANVITGGEYCFIGTLSHLSTGNGLDPALNGGIGGAYFVTDVMPKYVTASASYWATSSPINMKDALDRIAKQVSVNGVSPIPL